MRGKYSPTVTAAYMADQEWWEKYSNAENEFNDLWNQYDPEGYDSYGYDKDGTDRAGNHEYEYYADDDEVWGENYAYERALSEWTFDGTKPVRKA